MPTIEFRNTTRDGLAYVEIQATKKHVHKVATSARPAEVVTWTVRNKTTNPINNFALVDFYALDNGGTCFTAGPPAPVNIAANATVTVKGTADGDVDRYKYTVVANGVQVVDPELDIEP